VGHAGERVGRGVPNARLKLIAGDVRRLKPEREPPRGGFGGGGGFAGADTGFKEKSFFEYHLYTLGRPTSSPTTPPNRSSSSRQAISLSKVYVYAGLEHDYGYVAQADTNRDVRGRYNKKVDVYLELKNSEKNNLGIPLPPANPRLQRDEADVQAGRRRRRAGIHRRRQDRPHPEGRRCWSAWAAPSTSRRAPPNNFTEEGRTVTKASRSAPQSQEGAGARHRQGDALSLEPVGDYGWRVTSSTSATAGRSTFQWI